MRIALVVFALLAPAGAAFACSCVRPSVQRTLVPADGATGVPIDGAIRVYVTGGVPSNIRARLGEAYRIIGPDGPVPLTTRVVRTRIDLVPKAPLAADTRYRIEQLFAYDTDGDRVDDDARLRLALSGGWVATRRWYPVSRFKTGTDRAAAPPTPAIAEAASHFARGGGDCGPGSALSVRYASADPALVVELEVEGHGVVATAPMSGRIGASDMLCNPDKFRLGKGPFEARIAFVGPNGTRTVSASRSAAGAGLFGRAGPVRPPPKPEWATLWFKGAIRPSPPNAAAGPPGCAAGVEAATSRQSATRGGRMAYDDRNAPAWIDGAVEALVVHDRAVGWGAPFRPAVSAASRVASAPMPDGTALVVSHREGDHRRVAAVALDPAGAIRWRTPIINDALNWKSRIAACGDRVVVSWERIVGQRYGAATVHWAVLRRADGTLIKRSAEGLPIQGEGAALGCGGDGVAWLVGRGRRPRRQLLMYRFADDDASAPVALPRTLQASTVALAPHPTGVALLTDRDGIQAKIVDAKGAVRAGPMLLGQGRKPVVVAHAGHFVAAWEQYPRGHAQVTAFDGDGRVAEAAQIGDYWGTVSLLARADAVHLVATAPGRTVHTARLACRAQPSDRAPARLP